ncbi:mannose-ethanolamine phosphotransferase gpi13 [Massospora cicadina]|nr:mannose-ethanolamine phosphotransferase gpi13 [Massospora cicadina]
MHDMMGADNSGGGVGDPTNPNLKEQAKYENRQHITRVHLILTIFLLWILSTTGVGLMFFKNGFLLTRNALPNVSSPDSPFVSGHTPASDLPAKFSRAIIVIIDALRYDFVAPDGAPAGEPVRGVPYRNQMPFAGRIIQEKPDSAILYEFVADAPTTTMQRLKGLTTGTLPTFVDAGSNFAGTEILEDTWLLQLRKAGRHASFLGDDTWGLLFPTLFDESYPFSSFDVWDLHSVDEGILANFDAVFNQTNGWNWDVIVTHFLGVDHCGHRYGPDHPEMALKLAQLDRFLERLYNQIGNDTILMVFGDHGMDRKGDHGGETPQETGAALLVMAQSKLRDTSAQQQLMRQLGMISNDGTVPHFIHHSRGLNFGARSIQQIDLVPSLSLLLGLPIPFNNLGMVIPELFLSSDPALFLEALRRNAVQVHTYLQEYARLYPTSDIANHVQTYLAPSFAAAHAAYLDWLEHTSTAKLQDVLYRYAVFLRNSLASCRSSWAQFDPVQIQMGLTLLFSVCAVLLYHCLFRSHPSSQPHFGRLNGPILAYIFGGGILGAFCAANGSIDAGFDAFGESVAHLPFGDSCLFGGFFGTCLGYFVSAVMDYRQDAKDSAFAFALPYNHHLFRRLYALDGWLVAFNLAVMGVAGFLSASVWMAENEDAVVMYLLQAFTLMLLVFAYCLRPSVSTHAVVALRGRLLKLGVGLLVLNQVVSFVTVCREEQLPRCSPTFYGRLSWDGGSIATTTPVWILALFAFVCTALPSVLRKVLVSTRNFYTSAPLWLDWGLRGCLTLVVAYWFLDTNELFLSLRFAVDFKNVLIRLAFGLAVVFGTGNFFLNPLLVDVQMVRTVAEGSLAHSMVVLGFGNAYGAPMLLFLSVVLLPLMMAQQPMGGIILSLSLVQMIVVAEVLDALRDVLLLVNPRHPAAMMPPRALDFAGASLFYLLSYQGFFATGHQATLSSLQWKVGFIGLKTMSWFISPALVVVNTLGPFILGGVGVLLVVYWKSAPDRAALFKTLPYSLSRVSLFFTLLHGVGLAGSAGWAAYHQRHLLVWKLFAPRFLLGALSYLSAVAALLFLALFFPSPHILNEVSDVLAHLKQE